MTHSKHFIQEIKGYSYPWNLPKKRNYFCQTVTLKTFGPICLAFYLRYWKHGACELLLNRLICDFYCFDLFLSVLDEWPSFQTFSKQMSEVRNYILEFLLKKMVVIPTGIYIRAYIFDKWRWNSLRNHIFHCFCDLGKHFLWKILKSILNKLNLRSFDMQIEKFSIPWLVNSHQ